MACSMELLNFMEECEKPKQLSPIKPTDLPNQLIMKIIKMATEQKNIDAQIQQSKQNLANVLSIFDDIEIEVDDTYGLCFETPEYHKLDTDNYGYNILKYVAEVNEYGSGVELQALHTGF